MAAGLAFDLGDTGGNFSFVYPVIFLTVRTGDFHMVGSGFRVHGSGLKVLR